MNRALLPVVTIVAALASTPLRGASAQRAVTVSGHVTSQGAPLAGAHVRIDELRIDRATDAEGRFSFVVPGSSVHGQTVTAVATMSDRRIRYVPASAAIVLTGVPVVQDFDLKVATQDQPIVAAVPRADSSASRSTVTIGAVSSKSEIDVSDATGLDLPSVLIGRIAGLSVSPASTPGGSAQLTFRGPRSVLGSSQPLFVVDGMPMNNMVFASSAQRFGLGGFDYGSSISDIDLSNVASVRMLSGAEASAAYGGRGANGVIAITTKTATEGPHFAIAATYQNAGGSYLRLPELQNQFGQGLNGKFEFFDGRGGGINDAVDQNWGPALDGRPVAQASYREAGRGDVRLWVARPNNVQNYFVNGGTSNTTATIQGRNDIVSFRAMLGDLGVDGITSRDRLERQSAAISLTFQPSPRFSLAVSGLGAATKNENAPGTGTVDGNPAFQFMRMGRQVDTDSLEKHLRDATGKEVSWIYTEHNNPFFESGAGNNYSRRYHTAGAASVVYALTPSLTASARGGVDNFRDGRLLTVPSGWMGGFPFFSGAGNFSRGGSEGDEVSVEQSSAAFRLDSKHTLASGTRWNWGAGVDVQSNDQRLRSAGVDSAANVPAAGAPDTARVPQPVTWSAKSSANSVVADAGLAFTNGASVEASMRNAWVSMVPSHSATVLLPSVRGAYDFGHGKPLDGGMFSSATLRGSWWMDTPESTPYSLETMYAGRTPSGTFAPVGSNFLASGSSLAPEVTSGFEVGTDLSFRRFGLALGLTYYHEATSDVILPVGSTTSSLVATNIGGITNQGVDARLTARFGDGEEGLGWNISANASKNSNNVDQLSAGVSALPLGPSQWGLNVEARPGQPLGVLRGLRLLRNSSGSLMLKNGLPVGDSASGPQQLGVAQPSWSFGLGNTLRYRWFSFTAQADARVGGQVFSATNMIGTYSGTLASTSFRPDSGLLIAGVDAATGQANTRHVSAQDYYHALGSVPEPWVYSATFIKLREARFSATLPTRLRSLPFEAVRASIVGRNLGMWSKAPNIDPELVFSSYQLRGVEMGQLPTAKSIGVEITIVP